MFDKSIEYHDLCMVCMDTDVEAIPLPKGFGFRYFVPGDERHWVRIEQSAGEFSNPEDGHKAFERYYGAHQDQLPARMIFLLDQDRAPIGTATAWFNESMGHLHWVAIDEAHQGMGLSRALVAHAMRRIHELGDREARLTTQTPSWVAVRVYLSLGWLPHDDGKEDFEAGWKVIESKVPEGISPHRLRALHRIERTIP